jgi:hypothetical protein
MLLACRRGWFRSLVRMVAAPLALVVLVGSVRILGGDCYVELATNSEPTAAHMSADHSGSGDSCACFCDCGCAGVLLTFVSSSEQAALVEAPTPTTVTKLVGFHDSVHPSPPTRPPRA